MYLAVHDRRPHDIPDEAPPWNLKPPSGGLGEGSVLVSERAWKLSCLQDPRPNRLLKTEMGTHGTGGALVAKLNE